MITPVSLSQPSQVEIGYLDLSSPRFMYQWESEFVADDVAVEILPESDHPMSYADGTGCSLELPR